MAHVLLGGVLAQITELVPPQPHHAALIELFPHTGSPAGGVEPVAHGLHVSVAEGGGPFGAVVVRRGEVVATGTNSVTLLNDPTAHAEVSAIRAACAAVKDFKLEECEIYSSCEPCPMCLSAIYWAGIRKIYFANTREDAKRIGFDDSFIYDQIPLAPSRRTVPSEEMMRAEACLLYTSPSPRDTERSRMPSSA